MVYNNIWTMADRIKTRLTAFPALAAYNEIVDIRRYRTDELPDFNNYGIIVTPLQEVENNGDQDDPRGGLINGIRFEWDFLIVGVVRKYHPTTSLIGSTPAGVGAAGVGIAYHMATIKDALRAHSFGNYVDVSKKETRGEIQFNEVFSPERDHFYWESFLPWHGQTHDDVMPDVS